MEEKYEAEIARLEALLPDEGFWARRVIKGVIKEARRALGQGNIMDMARCYDVMGDY